MDIMCASAYVKLLLGILKKNICIQKIKKL